MQTAMLAIGNELYKEQIMYYLSSNFAFVLFNPETTLSTVPDILIVDLANLKSVVLQQGVTSFRTFSILLILSTEEMPLFSQQVAKKIDEVIVAPIHEQKLLLRLRNLMLKQSFMETQEQLQRMLVITNKALESSSDAFVISNEEGIAIYVNPAFETQTGYTVTELNTYNIKNMLFLMPELSQVDLYDYLKTYEVLSGEVELITKDGIILPFILNMNTIKNERGQLIGFISSFVDISHQKQIRNLYKQQGRMIQAQLDSLKDISSTLDISEVLNRILKNINRVITCAAANIILIEAHEKVKIVIGGTYDDISPLVDLQEGETSIAMYHDLRLIFEKGETLFAPVTSLYSYEQPTQEVLTPWLNSHIAVPIYLNQSIIGCLNVDSYEDGFFTEEHVKQALLFAELAAIAIQNAHLYEGASQLATIQERQRLARNLHDAVSQTLFSSNIVAESLFLVWDKNPADVKVQLKHIQNLNRGALAELRSLLMELYPERLLDTPIADLIQYLVDGVLGRTKIEVQLDVAEDIKLIPDVKLAIYYIVQEALNNIVKHAQASCLHVRLEKTEDGFNLIIRDNGQGFDTKSVLSKNLGLGNMSDRAQLIDADLRINSEIGKGTEIVIKWSN